MHGRMATYSFTGDADALSRRAEEGLLPLLNAQPGFKSYTIAVGDGEVISISAWDSRADAEAGSDAVASWVADNLAAELTLKDVRYAEIKLSTTLGVSTAAAAA